MPTLASACDELYGLDLEQRAGAGLRDRLARLGVDAAPIWCRRTCGACRLPTASSTASSPSPSSSICAPTSSASRSPRSRACWRRAGACSSAARRCIALMNAAFGAIGFCDIEHHHFSDIADVVAAAEAVVHRRALGRDAAAAAALPLGWAPYTTVLFARRRRGRFVSTPSRRKSRTGTGGIAVRRDILDAQLGARCSSIRRARASSTSAAAPAARR